MARTDSNTVYIVDDDASLRRSFRNLLNSVGFQVETFESAEKFLEAAHRLSAGCLVLDLRMPGMGGLGLLRHLSAIGSHHRVIVLTGHGDGDARHRCLSAGAIAFLEKPFESDELLEAVGRAMSLLSLGMDAAVPADAKIPNTSWSERHMSVSERPIRFARGTVGKHCHICAFFNGPEEEHRVLRSFVKDGIDAGERGVHIVGPEERNAHLQWLRNEGIDVEHTMFTGQLEVHSWDDVYLRDDRFDQDAVLATIDDGLRANNAAGYTTTRVLAHMDWALLDKEGVDDLLEYETRANYLLPKYNMPVICAYDLSKFSAGIIMDILRTHPMVIIGGVLRENPFFVPPDQLLFEMRARRLERSAATS
jgi:FixJ family two-component response regulator